MALDAYARVSRIGADVGDAVAQAAAANNRGSVHEAAGQLNEALPAYEEALALTEKLADGGGQARVLANLGRSAATQGDGARAAVGWQRALTLYQDDLSGREQAKDVYGQSRVLLALADLFLDQGIHSRAVAQAERAQALSQQIGDRDGRAAALERLGRSHTSLGNKLKAREAYRLALSLVESADRWATRLAILQQLGEVEVLLGNVGAALDAFGRAVKLSDTAERSATRLQLLSAMRVLSLKSANSQGTPGMYQQVATLYEQLGDVTKQLEALSELARTLRRIGDGPGAIKAYKYALDVSQKARSSNPARLLVELAQTQRQVGDAAGALATYQLVLDLSRQAKDAQGEASLAGDLGQMRCASGAAGEGLRLVQQALSFAVQANEPSWQRSLWLTMAGCQLRKGDPQRAREALQHAEALRAAAIKRGGDSAEKSELQRALGAAAQALALSRQLGSKSWEADVMGDYGDAQLGLGHHTEAQSFYQQALSLCQEMRDVLREARAHERLGNLHAASSEFELAVAAYQRALSLLRSSGPTADHDRVAKRLHDLKASASESSGIINRVRNYLNSRPEERP